MRGVFTILFPSLLYKEVFMKVKLYTFDKKYNSTKRPTATGTEFECLLKTSSSIISPTLELNIGLVSNPSAYNYAYIQAYERYYWVSEWTFTNTSWIDKKEFRVTLISNF